MSDNKQSSVEWLVKEINQIIDFIPMDKWDEIRGVVQQAKAMHKEEIKDAVGVGSQFDRDYLYGYHDKAEQYYNENFNG